MKPFLQTDVLIIGGGLAGLACALKINPNISVTLITKGTLEESNTYWAQGGIAAVLSQSDSYNKHIQDTLVSGAGLCNPTIAQQVIYQGPERIQDLIKWGVPLDRDINNNELLLTREGGHSKRRITHVEDHTGRSIQNSLLSELKKRPHTTIIENSILIDLIINKQDSSNTSLFHLGPTQALGVFIYNKKTSQVIRLLGNKIILATGGAGTIYKYSSNWPGATGDGVAAAFRAGARVANLEFMQFHPTALFNPLSSNSFLISEALRGEGGELINSQGEAFMKRYHPLGSLAHRDIVSRAIDQEIKHSGHKCVYLDMSPLKEDYLKKRFPTIFNHCLNLGINISHSPIPVVPAAHYLCGGVLAELNGKTDIENLFVIGESSCTGLHGANRLASNSLLECLVMAHECASSINQASKGFINKPESNVIWENSSQTSSIEKVTIHHMWEEIRNIMWNYVGIMKSQKRLLLAQQRLSQIYKDVSKVYFNNLIDSDLIELRNLSLMAYLSTLSALKRKESRGIHFNSDFPNKIESNPPQNTIIWPGDWVRNPNL